MQAVEGDAAASVAIGVAIITQAGLVAVAWLQLRRARQATQPAVDDIDAVEVLQEIVDRLRLELNLTAHQVGQLTHQNSELRDQVSLAHATAGRALEHAQELARRLRAAGLDDT